MFIIVKNNDAFYLTENMILMLNKWITEAQQARDIWDWVEWPEPITAEQIAPAPLWLAGPPMIRLEPSEHLREESTHVTLKVEQSII